MFANHRTSMLVGTGGRYYESFHSSARTVSSTHVIQTSFLLIIYAFLFDICLILLRRIVQFFEVALDDTLVHLVRAGHIQRKTHLVFGELLLTYDFFYEFESFCRVGLRFHRLCLSFHRIGLSFRLQFSLSFHLHFGHHLLFLDNLLYSPSPSPSGFFDVNFANIPLNLSRYPCISTPVPNPDPNINRSPVINECIFF